MPVTLPTPPEDSIENLDIDTPNGVTLTEHGNHNTATHVPSITTSIGASNTAHANSLGTYLATNDLVLFEPMEDEDQDMSDGGAALASTISHEVHIQIDMDMFNTEPMGHDGLGGTPTNPDLHNMMLVESSQATPNMSGYNSAYGPGGGFEDFGPMPVPAVSGAATTDLPAVMSEVSQQLQHIQDGQQHGDNDSSQAEHHDPFLHNQSTASLPFTSLPPVSVATATQHDVATVVSSHSQPPAVVGSTQAQTGFLNNWTNIPVMDASFFGQAGLFNSPSHLNSLDAIWADDQESDADHAEVEHQINMNFGAFLLDWADQARMMRRAKDRRYRGPAAHGVARYSTENDIDPVTINDLKGEECDFQRIDWSLLGVSRLEARQMRRQTYKNYTNLRYINPQWHKKLPGARLPNDENYFRFRRMDFQPKVHLAHFQLRNLIACPSRDRIFFASTSKVMHYNTSSRSAPKALIDMSNPLVRTFNLSFDELQISTMASAHDIVVAGGFAGQYGLMNIRARKGMKASQGVITEHINNITNHVQIHLSRSSSSPLVTFSSNDSGVRTLDVATNKFISSHMYEPAINCTAESPDQRLRVMVGDTRRVMICNSDTGEILQGLDGHRDFGFACAWSGDGWTVATGNQDMLVKIWDARKWTNSAGIAQPVQTIASEMAGVRGLKFSPIGSGRRVLAAAEPGDYVNIINAETFDSKQVLSFFGEIGGIDFTDDGQSLIVANCDRLRGGIMEFDRCDFATEGFTQLDEDRRRFAGQKRARNSSPMDEYSADHPELWSTTKRREGRAALLTNIPPF
ncbi:hypothetical protein ACMFMF_000707 [Clarireedia jacksonii]